MTKKAFNILLIVIVIILWIIIGARMYLMLKRPTLENTEPKRVHGTQITPIDDTLGLKLDYPDPFLAKTNGRSGTSHKKSTPITTPITSADKKTAPKWPSITYSGMVKPANGLSAVAVLTVDGKPCLLRYQEMINDLRPLYIGSDSLIIEYKKEKRTLKKVAK
jgi:hypothetical protein